MKVYVAGASSEKHIIVQYMSRLRQAGIELSHDWTAECEGNDASLTKEQRRRYAENDLHGIHQTDVFWMVCPDDLSASISGTWADLPKCIDVTPSRGVWFEFGFAFATATIIHDTGWPLDAIIVSGPSRHGSIFTELATHSFETHEEALAFIIGAK